MGSDRNSPCFCGSGKKLKKCHSDITPDSRVGRVLGLYKELNERISDYKLKNPSHQSLCFAGCSSCCYHSFAVSDFEFKLIVREIKGWSEEKINNLRITFQKQLEYLKTEFSDIYKNLEEDSSFRPDIEFKQYMMTVESYNMPCPLLNTTNGECIIYDSRPFICRAHGTTYYIDDEYSVCDKISSNTENSKRTPDVSDLNNRYPFVTNIVIDGKINPIRKYPLIYWLKMLFENYDDLGRIEIVEEARDFRLPWNEADRRQIENYLRNYGH